MGKHPIIQKDIKQEKIKSLGNIPLSEILDVYLIRLKKTTYIPLSVHKAIERYFAWEKINPSATPIAKEQTIFELYGLYRLQRFPELMRYYLFRHTFFNNADEQVRRSFDRLIGKIMKNIQTPAIELIELSDLQRALMHRYERTMFSRMVFPKLESRQRVDVLKVGKDRQKQVIVHSYIKDTHGNQYTFREPMEPIEIGQLYRLFFKNDFNITISEQDKYFVICDTQDRIIGGLCYRFIEKRVVLLEGGIVASPLRERGIGSAMMKTFFEHMTGQGVIMIKTHFFLIDFYINQGFQVDKRYGALVKFLTPKIMENQLPENGDLINPDKSLGLEKNS